MNFWRAIKGFSLSLIFLIFFAYLIYGGQEFLANFYQDQDKNLLLGSISAAAENVAPPAAAEPVVLAKSAISVESGSWQGGGSPDKILFAKDTDAQLPIASLTKLMTAVVVLDNYNLSDIITVDKLADAQDPMKLDVKLGDTMSVESFLDIMLVESSNKSAYALSEKMGESRFVSLMNKKAKGLDLNNTFFADPTGLSSKNVSTANDLTKLAEYILRTYPQIADISTKKEITVPGFGRVANTDQLLGEVPEIVCSKTGFTAAANGCLLLVTSNPKNNDYIINVILGADDRFAEMKKLINWSSSACQ